MKRPSGEIFGDETVRMFSDCSMVGVCAPARANARSGNSDFSMQILWRYHQGKCRDMPF
jgi:hypothetical protein